MWKGIRERGIRSGKRTSRKKEESTPQKVSLAKQ
jgi:hypothetical protein